MDFERCNDSGDRVFNYKFHPGLGKPKYQLNLNLNVLSKESTNELCARVCNYHNIPCFIKADMSGKLRDFKERERLNYESSRGSAMLDWIRKNPDMISKVAEVVAGKYEKTWMCHAKPPKQNLKEFSQSYHYLIHSSAMVTLLELERKYQSVITRMLDNGRNLTNKLQERQQMEMSRVCEHVGFAYTQEDVLQIAARHVDEMERLESKRRDEYAAVSGDQRLKFRRAVTELADRMRRREEEEEEEGKVKEEEDFGDIRALIEEADAQQLQSPSSPTSTSTAVSGDSMSNDGAAAAAASVSSGTSSAAVYMEESFTVNLGNQLKTMHNLRLLVTDVLNYCRYADEREMDAQRFQTVMSLYSDSLSAVVILTDNQLDYSIGIEQELANICSSTNEFHFDSLSSQLDSIKNVVRQQQKDQIKKEQTDAETNEEASSANSATVGKPPSVRMKEGDLFITRHSNLSQAHLVFHLVADTSQLKSAASSGGKPVVNSRHPIYHGLRHALKVASDYEVKTLTIPLLLAHDVNDDMTSQWCLKRAELVMKWMKGFMIEMASWDSGVSRNIQFVLPPGISEQSFDAIRSTLPEVYRTTSTRNLTPQRPAGRAR